MADPVDSQPEQTFFETLLGEAFFKLPLVKRWMGLSLSLRVVISVATFAALVFIPYLGAVGLWDPWEVHYGEVARSMIQRNDYVIPFWENAWFFSKPVFTMWMMALGMQVAGTNRTDGALSQMTEWGMRMPFVLLSILALSLLGLALSRTLNRRVGFAAVFILVTSPLYFLLTRQAVTDTPVVTTIICAIACAIIGLFDDTTKHRAGWWYGFYVFCAFGILAKGLLGLVPVTVLFLYAILSVIPWDEKGLGEHLKWLVKEGFPLFLAVAVPAVAVGLYLGLGLLPSIKAGRPDIKLIFGCVIAYLIIASAAAFIADRFFVKLTAEPPVLWAQFYKMKLATGLLLLCAVALPWYLKLSLFKGVDDESKDFFTRFIIHDHFNRLGAGVHTTTPGGSFTYFIEQGGYALFPWVALLPGAIAVLARVRLRGGTKWDGVAVLAFVWALVSFALVGFSATKFHHYTFPILPGLAILLALFVDKLWSEGVSVNSVLLLFGGVIFALVGVDLARNPKNFTDLFVYNYDRPYPNELVNLPITFLTEARSSWAEFFGIVALLGAAFLLMLSVTSKRTSGLLRPLGFGITGYAVAVFIASGTQSVRPPLLSLGVALLLVAGTWVHEVVTTESEKNFGISVVALITAIVAGWLLFRGFAGPRASENLNVKTALGWSFGAAAIVCVLAMVVRSRGLLFGAFGGFALVFTVWFNWSHWVDLSHQWTQRDLFARYYKLRQPDEPIAVFLMNWRGETYYSKNTVKQIPMANHERITKSYAAQPGRKWALVEHNRLDILKGLVAQAGKKTTPVDPELNNKFVLVSID